jgi:hypothetical protein
MLHFYRLLNGEKFQNKDFSELDAILAPELVDHDPMPGQGPGMEGLKNAFAVGQPPDRWGIADTGALMQ